MIYVDAAVSLHSDYPQIFRAKKEAVVNKPHSESRRKRRRGVSTWLSGCQHPLLALAAQMRHMPFCRPPIHPNLSCAFFYNILLHHYLLKTVSWWKILRGRTIFKCYLFYVNVHNRMNTKLNINIDAAHMKDYTTCSKYQAFSYAHAAIVWLSMKRQLGAFSLLLLWSVISVSTVHS